MDDMETSIITELMTELGENYLPKNANELTPSTEQWVAPVDFDDNAMPVVVSDDKRTGLDIYHLMSNDGKTLAKRYGVLAVFVTGWGAPMTEDKDSEIVAPSAHPERERVAMLCLVTKDGLFGSAVRIGSRELMVDDNGQGNLRDEALAMFA